MSRSLARKLRLPVLGGALAAAVAAALAPLLAQTEETKCYLMVCKGTVCVAKQVDCTTLKPVT